MTRYAYTGPTRPTFELQQAAIQSVRDLPFGSKVISGGAYGIDTIIAEEAHDLGRFDLILVVPRGKPWNRRLRKIAHRVIVADGGYRKRNKRLVGEADRLIACLLHDTFYRSGEWMTVNIALRAGVPIERIVCTSD